MPRSMTGYGAAQATGSRISVDVELRSVNARSLKVTLRSSPLLAPREPEMEALVRRHVRRGTITAFLRVQLLRPQDAVRVRPEIVEGVAKALEPLRKRGLIEGKLTPDAVVALPGALEIGASGDLRPADWRVAKQALTDALEALNAMRTREAVHLARDLNAIVRRLRKTLGAVRRLAPKAVVEHRKRLQDRLDELLAPSGVKIDEAVLAREVAVLADRSDITEEMTRLAAHLDEFESYLDSVDEIGRRLDFLTQEMLREVNTMGSKSSDVGLSRAVISMKSDVDRLKEQVANLE